MLGAPPHFGPITAKIDEALRASIRVTKEARRLRKWSSAASTSF
jgi:hypothetical protein